MSTHPLPHAIRARSSRVAIAVVAAVASVLALSIPASAQDVIRVEGGQTVVDRAVGWSTLSFADGSAPDVLLARDDEFADSLAAGAVQGALDAPLLMTDTDELSDATAAEIERLGAETVYVLGGTEAVSEAVVDAVEALDAVEGTERIAGATRIETAVAIADRFFPNATEVFLARAFGDTDPTQAFADSLGLAPASAATNLPILLTATDALSGPTADALAGSAVQRIVVVGGTDAVSEAAASDAEAAIAPDGTGADAPRSDVVRITGDNRFSTAVALNGEQGYATGADAPRIILTEGQATDAWTSGFPAGSQASSGAATVLSNGDDLPPETVDFLSGATVPLLCGPGVSDIACDAAAEAIAG